MIKFLISAILLSTINALNQQYFRRRHGYLLIGGGGSSTECINSERHTTRTGCAVLCINAASCKSISYRKTDGCCVLNTQQLYDFDVNYEENPLWDYYGPVKNEVTSDRWTLVFKAVSGTGTNIWNAWSESGVSHDLDLTNQNPAYFSKYATSSSFPFFRSHLLDDWPSEGDTGVIKDVKLSLYENGTEVAYMVFDGTGSTRDNWFSLHRLFNTTWTDLYIHWTYIFSIEGDKFRKFYITMTESLYNCDNFGWLIVLNRPTNACEFDKEAPPPQFLYSKGNTGNYFKYKLYGLAQVLAVFVRF